jgi:hypothetical protein
MKKYGFPAFVTYSLISTADLILWYAIFSYTGTDMTFLDPIKPYLSSVKSWFTSLTGSSDQLSTPSTVDLSVNVEAERKEVAQLDIDTKKYPAFQPAQDLWRYVVQNVPSSFIIAFTVHKLVLPLRIMATVPATPMVARFMQRWTWWKKRS